MYSNSASTGDGRPVPLPADVAHERRIYLRLRAVFDSALSLVAPFFDHQRTWSGISLEHFAYRVLREHHPELSALDIYIFLAAARRIHARESAAVF